MKLAKALKKKTPDEMAHKMEEAKTKPVKIKKGRLYKALKKG